MESDRIKAALSEGEGQRVEFKESFAEQDEAIRTLCAFSNSDGGIILFGVRNDKTLVGVSVGSNTIENFVNKLQRETRPNLRSSIIQCRIDSKIVVAASVEPSGLGMLYYAFKAPYERLGNTNQVMDPDKQRARLLSERSAQVSILSLERAQLQKGTKVFIPPAAAYKVPVSVKKGEVITGLTIRAIEVPGFTEHYIDSVLFENSSGKELIRPLRSMERGVQTAVPEGEYTLRISNEFQPAFEKQVHLLITWKPQEETISVLVDGKVVTPHVEIGDIRWD
jgi:hypothetical protein